ncbi:MAG: DNA-binding protein [Thermoprotei archaeon]|nr:MAG: DNA-binding protein [Thermoprotei archaeon]
MARREEVELIRDRALRMLNSAKHHLSVGDYDIAAFMAEQAAQLFIKCKILEATGEMPRTHVIRRLLGVLRDLSRDGGAVEDFVKRRRSLLIRLEEAYLALRYLFRRYERDEVEELVSFAEEVIEFVRDLQV